MNFASLENTDIRKYISTRASLYVLVIHIVALKDLKNSIQIGANDLCSLEISMS